MRAGAPAATARHMSGHRRGGLGVGGDHPSGFRVRADRGIPARPMPPSISAPTIAGCWWRARRGDGFRVIDAFSRIVRLGEGMSSTRPHLRCGDRACGRGARHLPRQDAQSRGHARAPDRHRGVPRRRERRRVPSHASPRRSGSSSRSSIARPRRDWRRPAVPR